MLGVGLLKAPLHQPISGRLTYSYDRIYMLHAIATSFMLCHRKCNNDEIRKIRGDVVRRGGNTMGKILESVVLM